MVIADKTKLPTTVCTAIFELGHGAIFQFRRHIRTHGQTQDVGIATDIHLLSAPCAWRSRDRRGAALEATWAGLIAGRFPPN
jgi:hypothetical protein